MISEIENLNHVSFFWLFNLVPEIVLNELMCLMIYKLKDRFEILSIMRIQMFEPYNVFVLYENVKC